MDFSLSTEQTLLVESLRGYLGDRVPLTRLRQVAESGTGFDADIWQGLSELGLPGLVIPERFGGAGLGMLDAAVAAEALGYFATPAPFAASMTMAALAFVQSGTTAQQSEFLPGIAGGESRFAMGFSRLAGQTGKTMLSLDGSKLTGQIAGALDAGAPTHVLVYLADGRAAVVDATAAGVRIDMKRSIDRTRPVADIAFDNVSAVILDAANDRLAAARRVLDAGRLMLAADTLGVAQYMLDRAIEHVKTRVQFGRIIGSFQGLKYSLVDAVTMLEPCRAMIWYAAHAQDALPAEARLTALHAKAHLGDVGRDVARVTTEAHGGMGFTDLLGLHYWFKRITFDRQMLGGPERCREEAAELQGWGRRG